MENFEKTFDNASQDYDTTRPLYVRGIYDEIFRYKPVGEESRVLEIGIGSGKATLPILEKGCRLQAVEPGDSLADIAEQRFEKYERFSLYRQRLEDFRERPESFDLIYSATAFHWIPEEYGYRRVYELLKKGGAFARFAYHAGPDQGRKALSREIQDLYREYMSHEDAPGEYGEDDAAETARIAEKYGFSDITYRLYHTEKDFSADGYLKLLRTYPDHMRLEEEKRRKLFDGIHRLIQMNGGVITVYYTMDLQLARKSVP